jgi:hypothetical protein
VPGSILAAVTPDNTPAGAVLTFAFPLGLFIVIAVILYLRFARPHRRVPAAAAGRATPAAAVPGPDTARGAAIASGLPIAVGGGGAEHPVEPAGGVRRAAAEPAPAEPAEPVESAPAESAPAEPGPAGSAPAAEGAADGGAGPNPAGQSAPGPGPSNVSGRDGAPAGPDGPEDGAADGGKASE